MSDKACSSKKADAVVSEVTFSDVSIMSAGDSEKDSEKALWPALD